MFSHIASHVLLVMLQPPFTLAVSLSERMPHIVLKPRHSVLATVIGLSLISSSIAPAIALADTTQTSSEQISQRQVDDESGATDPQQSETQETTQSDVTSESDDDAAADAENAQSASSENASNDISDATDASTDDVTQQDAASAPSVTALDADTSPTDQSISLLASNASISALADDIADAIYDCETYLDVSSYGFDRDAVQQAFYLLRDEHPEFFYMPTCYPMDEGDGTIAYIDMRYDRFSPSEIPSLRSKYEAKVKEAVSWTSPTMSELEKAKALHDWIVRNVSYGYNKDSQYTQHDTARNAYGPIVKGRGICEGYAEAYKDFCHRVGITCDTVSSSEIRHEWNIVTINGQNYHVDCCWDDPIIVGSSDAGWNVNVSSRNFMMSDTRAQVTNHRGWKTSLRCTDPSYDNASWKQYWGPVSSSTYTFTDVEQNAWYVTSGVLSYVIDNGIMHGYDSSHFGPNDSLTRAQFAAILYNRVGGDYTSSRNETGMSDVKANQWYTAAANWAVDTGAIGGYANADGSRSFAPDAPITRQEIVAILCNIADGKLDSNGSDAKLSDYDDADAVAGWAKDAMAQGVASGLIQGSGGKLRPGDRCSRVEGATFVVRAITELGII